MRIAGLIARYLLGLIFLVFGLNGFLHFIPMAPMPGAAGQFMGAIYGTGYLTVIFLLEIIPALLLLAGRYVPLALVLLGPVIVNILLFHAFLNHAGLPIALLVVLLWALVAWNLRSAFAGILQQKA
jgi:putative oxidoreductase